MGGGDHFGGADPDATPLDEGEVTNIACCHCLNLCPTSFLPSPFSNSRSLSAKDSYKIISVEVFNFDNIFSFSQPMTFIQNLMSIPTTKGAGEQHHCNCRSNRGMRSNKEMTKGIICLCLPFPQQYFSLSAFSPPRRAGWSIVFCGTGGFQEEGLAWVGKALPGQVRILWFSWNSEDENLTQAPLSLSWFD